MSIIGMYMLNSAQYEQEKIHHALDISYADRKSQFHELSQVLLNVKALKTIPNWQEFVLNFCLDVEEAFKRWSGQSPLSSNSPQKAQTLLRQLGHDKTSMNQLAHMLNISYNLSAEFKEIYRRLN